MSGLGGNCGESYLGLLFLKKLVFKGHGHSLGLRPLFLWLKTSGLTAGAKGDKARPLLGWGGGEALPHAQHQKMFHAASDWTASLLFLTLSSSLGLEGETIGFAL